MLGCMRHGAGKAEHKQLADLPRSECLSRASAVAEAPPSTQSWTVGRTRLPSQPMAYLCMAYAAYGSDYLCWLALCC